MFTSFKELEAYVLGCGMKKRIALANAHDEPALSAVVNARRKGVVEGTLVGKKNEIIAMLHEMGESEKDYEIVDFDGEELDAAKLTVQLVREGKIGKLHETFYTTVGNGTSVANAKKFAAEYAQKLLKAGVHAVIMTST